MIAAVLAFLPAGLRDRLAKVPAFLFELLAGVLLVVLLVLAKRHYDEARREEGRAEIRAQVTAEAERQRQANALETLRRLEAQKKAESTYDAQLAAARAAAARADAAARGLRSDLARFRAAASHPGPVAQGASAGDPIGVLADVLGRADDRAGALAKFADAAHAAGQLCERQYDALTTSP